MSALEQAWDMLRYLDDKFSYLEREHAKDANDIDELSQNVDEKDKEIKLLKEEAREREDKLAFMENKHLEARLKYHDDLDKVTEERDKAQAMLQSQAELFASERSFLLEAREERIKSQTNAENALEHDRNRNLSKRVIALERENSLLARERDNLQAQLDAHVSTATANVEAMHQAMSDLIDENKQLSKQNKHAKNRPHQERPPSPFRDSLAAELELIAESSDSHDLASA